MVRTKADISGIKVSGAKAPRKTPSKPPAQSSGSGASSANYSGGNSYKPQPTPEWQKEITSFFRKEPEDSEENATSLSATENKHVDERKS